MLDNTPLLTEKMFIKRLLKGCEDTLTEYAMRYQASARIHITTNSSLSGTHETKGFPPYMPDSKCIDILCLF